MSQDTNECRLTGTIEKIRSIITRTGAPMAEIILRVRQDRFRVVAHGNVAEHLLVAAGPDDRLSATGTLATSSWKDETTGEWKNSFSVTAWGAEIHGDKISYQRKQQQKDRRRAEMYEVQPGDPF